MNIVYQPLQKTGQEAEYKKRNYLPISSVGTDYTTANETNLPYGSALLTDTLDGSGKGTSQLHNKNITHIIHAAPAPERNFTSRDDFIRQVVKAVQNCIFLADRKDIQAQVKIDKLAICFVGGGIFCDNEDTKPLLAESIIKGGLNQIEQCQNLKEIIFVSFMGAQDKSYYFEEAWNKVDKDPNYSGKINNKAKIKRGDIREKTVHGANVIVNAANTYVGFGGGISGAIGSETGNSVAIDKKAKEWIGKFYSQIKAATEESENPDQPNSTLPTTCYLCSQVISSDETSTGETSTYEGKVCHLACLTKQMEKENSHSETPTNGNLTSVRTQALVAIQQALDSEPKLTTKDLLSDYQNYESIINQLSQEIEINNLKEKTLQDIQVKRQAKREALVLDEKINSAQTETEKVNLFSEAGEKLGEQTPEQKAALERIKDDLEVSPSQLLNAIQNEIIAQMTTFKVKEEDLTTSVKVQWEQLKNELNPTKIRQIEKVVTQEIGEKYAQREVNNLNHKVESVLKTRKKTEIQKVKNELIKLISSPNSFLKAQKSQFQNLLQKLEKEENQSPNQAPNNQPRFPWKIVLPISFAVTLGVIGLVIIFKKTRRKLR